MERLLRLIKKIIPAPVFLFFQPVYHRLLALVGAAVYGFPGYRLAVVGVTGTNGKSTVVEMLHDIFASAGYKTASLSSVRFKIGDEEIENRFRMTMPGRFFVQQFLARAKREGATHVILEVTSEGIKQFRHKYIPLAAAVLTNLTPEHIEAHGGFENYRRAKGELFRELGGRGISVVNLDDPAAEYFLNFPAKEKIGYALESGAKWQGLGVSRAVLPSRYEIDSRGIRLYFAGEWEAAASLEGKFNAENMLAAIAAAEAFGIPHEATRRVFEKFRGVPGRMEEIQKEPFRVIVDYAFTPNALRQVYQTLKEELITKDKGLSGQRAAGSLSAIRYPLSARLICVLGAAGGGRDKWKRPELGKLAGEYCDRVIVTDEDPYDENPRSIMEEVQRGAEMRNAHSEIIEDRRIAIRDALGSARPGDTVIITGKGCESSIAIGGGKKIPWDDRQVVKEELKALSELPESR